MDIVIGTYPSGRYKTIATPDGAKVVELYIAEAIEPKSFWAGKSGILYASPPMLRLNACANAMRWAEQHCHRVLGGEEARQAIGMEPDPSRN